MLPGSYFQFKISNLKTIEIILKPGKDKAEIDEENYFKGNKAMRLVLFVPNQEKVFKIGIGNQEI